jgi:undecaprenyl-diphosphatase
VHPFYQLQSNLFSSYPLPPSHTILCKGAILLLWKIILIGIVEGITEWLPISSTGHMLLLDAWLPLPMDEAFKEMFFVVIQLGAILAVAAEYGQQLFRPCGDTLRLWARVMVGCIPAGVLGLLLDDVLEARFGTPTTIAAMLILYGIAFLAIESRPRTPRTDCIGDLSYPTALGIGLCQALAMIPGTSRSGATILGGLLLGVSRTAAAEYSFFLAMPTMLGASALKLVKFGFAFSFEELCALFVGMVTAFGVSMLTIRFLVGFVRRHDFKVFGRYRIALGIFILILSS